MVVVLRWEGQLQMGRGVGGITSLKDWVVGGVDKYAAKQIQIKKDKLKLSSYQTRLRVNRQLLFYQS